jgi:hypothetical protein
MTMRACLARRPTRPILKMPPAPQQIEPVDFGCGGDVCKTTDVRTIRRHGVDRKYALSSTNDIGDQTASVPTVHSGRSHPSWGFPRKSNGDDHRGNGEEQTGECLLQRNEVDLTTPDEERSAQGVKDARRSQSR